MHIDGHTVEDFYNRAHLDETQRKFLDGLKEGREEQDISPVKEKCSVMKKEINWRIESVKKREIFSSSNATSDNTYTTLITFTERWQLLSVYYHTPSLVPLAFLCCCCSRFTMHFRDYRY